MSNINSGISNETPPIRKFILTFWTIVEIIKFKAACLCPNTYEVKTPLSLVGTFTQEQLELAIYKYKAICKISKE